MVKTLEGLKRELENDPDNISIMESIADALIKNDEHGQAINYLNRILEKDQSNTLVHVKKEHVMQILKFKNSDIYARTNLNHDPWLDE